MYLKQSLATMDDCTEPFREPVVPLRLALVGVNLSIQPVGSDNMLCFEILMLIALVLN